MFFTQPLSLVIITALRTSTRFYLLFTWSEDAVWQNPFPLNNIYACRFVTCAQAVLKFIMSVYKKKS